jgi:hypothetical protein
MWHLHPHPHKRALLLRCLVAKMQPAVNRKPWPRVHWVSLGLSCFLHRLSFLIQEKGPPVSALIEVWNSHLASADPCCEETSGNNASSILLLHFVFHYNMLWVCRHGRWVLWIHISNGNCISATISTHTLSILLHPHSNSSILQRRKLRAQCDSMTFPRSHCK